MFNALKSMISKAWDFIPWPRTRQKQTLLTSYKKDLEKEIKKAEKKVRTRLTDEQKQERAKHYEKQGKDRGF